jgi:hypothetical protein
MAEITVERLEHAIRLTAYCMKRHDLQQLMPTIRRLIAARDDLIANGDHLEFADRILERGAIEVREVKSLTHDCSKHPNQPSTDAAF